MRVRKREQPHEQHGHAGHPRHLGPRAGRALEEREQLALVDAFELLVTVRRIAAEWDTDRRRELLHPELQSETEGAERVAARLLPPANRRLLSGAFQRLPQAARCLLWHTEVEAEPLAVPAGLLGLDEESAKVVGDAPLKYGTLSKEPDVSGLFGK